MNPVQMALPAADLDLQCFFLKKKDKSGFSRTRVNVLCF